MARVKAPRNVFVNFPLGRQCGKPDNTELQTHILKAALSHLETAKTPGEFSDLPFEWDESFDWNDYLKDVQEMLSAENDEVQNWKPKTGS